MTSQLLINTAQLQSEREHYFLPPLSFNTHKLTINSVLPSYESQTLDKRNTVFAVFKYTSVQHLCHSKQWKTM